MNGSGIAPQKANMDFFENRVGQSIYGRSVERGLKATQRTIEAAQITIGPRPKLIFFFLKRFVLKTTIIFLSNHLKILNSQ